MIVYQALSAYYVSYFLIGNYSMILRCKPFLDNGINTILALIIDIVVILGVVIAGLITLRKFDYIEKT